MIYQQKEPIDKLTNIVKKFWTIDSENDSSIHKQKIIPDGYPEMIFHYKDPYKIKIKGQWSLQSKFLIAGQIRNYFYLENTGQSGIFAITFQPWALKILFGIDMFTLVDEVVPINAQLLSSFQPIKQIATSSTSFIEKVMNIEEWFKQFLKIKNSRVAKGEKAARLIIEKNGIINIQQILNEINISERSLERYFKNYIGLSPKFYSRIIRLSYIFRLAQEHSNNWAELFYQAGFYDQSHFIKNFKEFTGDEPSQYGFDKQNLANFFLRQ